ncbi:MAG: protein kinase [Candidatus Sulfotelmatobacter sp.]|jgi:TolB-like protein/Flp pilus assembly protein TadD
MPLASGTKLGPYEVLAPLGAGGMGEVYRATDTKLGRDVALKVLPAEMAQDPERLGRFRREAKVLAQLDHPNIVTIHSVEECDGVHFLTMQLVEGLPLDRLIPQGGLQIEQIIDIASALGDALAAAHEKGIVHRDLKPANVMVSNDGRVKVLDFGLAKDVRGANLSDATMTSDSRTQVGVVMGTPAYMSPEQTSGRPLDHRTDIFSMGVLLHEMATGRRPFEGSSSAELVSAILRDTPPSITDVRPDLPSDLARIVRRCLEKDPRHRVQTARDVSNEFRDLSRQTSHKVAAARSSTARAAAVIDSGSARADEGFWVAVLPFKYAGTSAELKALADGLSEEIVTGLSRFSYLRVIARSSTLRYANEIADVRSAGKQLGARYVMEGSLRQAGSRLRLAVQLVDSTSGAHLWAETYDRPFQSEQLFELQDELVPRIVSTVGETHGVLPYSMSETLRNRDPNQLTPYEAVLRAFAYFKHVSAEEHMGARAALERAVEQAPGNADCWAMLAMLYREENNHGYNVRPDPVGRGLSAARRAVDLAPSNHLAHHALASVLFFRREKQAFRSAAQRAMELNPMDGFTLAYMGFLLSYSGEWERGCALMEKARNLNPNHPGWYWFPPFFNAYRNGEYREALELALKVNMPGFWRNEFALAVTYGQLGERELAVNAARELLAIRPNFSKIAREELAKWWQPELVEQLIDGLRKAGVEIAPEKGTSAPVLGSHSSAKDTSGAARADEGFWVAVLPLKYAGASSELKALADGLSDEIVTGLSRFSYLRVIARGSTAKYSSEARDIRAIGKELGARYLMEGNLRQAGPKLRVAVQLVDAVSGSHLWAETYERTFSPEAIFELQDELVPRIVSTVADMNGMLARSMSEAVRSRDPEQLSPYEAVLRSFGYFERVTPEDLAAAQSGLEAAVRKAPTYADAWAMLALLHVQDYAQGFGVQADALTSGATAARQAVAAAPSNHLAHFSLAQALFFQKEFQSFRNAAARAVELNPLDGNSLALLAEFYTYSGDPERGLALADRAKQLNPNHPGWYWHVNFNHAYRQGDYRGALSLILKSNMTENWGRHALMAAAYGQLGEREAASKALQELRRLRPDVGKTIQREAAKWFDAEHGTHLMEGLRKAGLEIADKAGTSVAMKAPDSGAVRTALREEEGFWVAVLPFKYAGSNADLRALADGLSEEVVTGLSRFSYLKVIARGSTAKYSSEGDVRVIGKELGARYVMEGTLRQAGGKLRLAVQLVEATTGSHLWAETFERNFTPETIFDLQDDLVPRIVSTVADQYGILAHSMAEALRGKPDDQLSPQEAVIRAFSYLERITPAEHAQVREILERAVRRAPDQSNAWAMLSYIYWHEHGQAFNPQPDPLGRALMAARRAVDAAPSNNLAHQHLACTLFFQKDFLAFRPAAERAIDLNPMDASTTALMGIFIAYSGDWEHGCALVESAMRLNPRHPGWYWFANFYNSYRKGDYRGALGFSLKINMPGYLYTHAVTAAAYGQLGMREAAQKALKELLALRPDFAATAGEEIGKWLDAEFVEHVIDGLRKAGLEFSEKQKSAHSGPLPAAQSIAVLPFANMSDDKEQDYFSDGLAEEIINLLAQISGLKVIARTSAFAFRGKEQDIRGIAETLGVKTVLEGSVRRSGSRIRVTAQLINAADGSHLWSERYDRELSDIFAVQDGISAAIAKALRVKLSREAAPQRYVPKLEAYEAYLKGRHHQAKVTPESLELARQCYEQASQLDPAFAMPHVGLAFYWHCLAHFGRHSAHECTTSTRAEIKRALEIDPSLPEAHAVLGYVAAMYDMDWTAAEKHFDYPMAKDAGFGIIRPIYGWFEFWRGNAERAIALAQRAIEEDPLEVWTRMNLHAYLQGAGRVNEALEQLKKVVELDPNQVVALVSMAMIYADKGDLQQALQIARRAYAIGPWSPDTIGALAGLTRRNGEEVESSLAKALGSGEAIGDARAHALFHLLCGEIDEGADWAEKAIEERDSSMMIYLRFVVSKGLRASHRWPKIAKMINLPVGAQVQASTLLAE